MLRTVNVKEEILITIQLVADLSYGWEIIVKYVPLMQQLIKSCFQLFHIFLIKKSGHSEV